MSDLLETTSKIILMILIVILFSHLMNGTATTWLLSKVKAAPA